MSNTCFESINSFSLYQKLKQFRIHFYFKRSFVIQLHLFMLKSCSKQLMQMEVFSKHTENSACSSRSSGSVGPTIALENGLDIEQLKNSKGQGKSIAVMFMCQKQKHITIIKFDFCEIKNGSLQIFTSCEVVSDNYNLH